jgi:glycosyltransferase involved in cell wall biosynthesis
MERLAFSLADVALVTNGSVAEIAVERGGMAPEDVFVVRNGPMLDRFTPVAPDPALKRGRDHLLVYVGLMGPQDGVDYALHALSQLRRERTDWHATFVGDGEMLPSLRELAAELELEDHVEFWGHGSDLDVRRAICSADVCLAPDPQNPYTDRSTLVKIAEYMAMERPTVSFDLTESRATAGDAALFATGNDPVQFTARISELLDDPELRHTLGAAGRARVESTLAWEHSEPTLLAAYERALEREPREPAGEAELLARVLAEASRP